MIIPLLYVQFIYGINTWHKVEAFFLFSLVSTSLTDKH